MTMKKLMNDPAHFVDESLVGILSAHPKLLKAAPDNPRAIVRAESPKRGKVAIITGGGYGHLPTFLGYVGLGLCDGVAVGNVFTSPSAESIISAAKAADGGAGILFLFGNYAGDTMNFEMASEILEMENIPCRIVKASDDIASAPKSDWKSRRGIGGIFLVYKMAGAKAEMGANLDEVTAMAEKACAATATMGIAFSAIQLPGSPKPIFTIGEDEIEIGMGIHGEPGVQTGPMQSSKALAAELLHRLIADQELQTGDEVTLLVNGLGATSREELYLFQNDAHLYLKSKGISIHETLVGEFTTSLEMAGVSITLMKMDAELKALLAQPAWSPFIRMNG
jgi:dihydroxyacetone kinase-like protein